MLLFPKFGTATWELAPLAPTEPSNLSLERWMLSWIPHHPQQCCVPNHLHGEHADQVNYILVPVLISAVGFS